MPRLRKLSEEEFENTPEADGYDISELEDQLTPLPGERYPYLAAWMLDRGWIELGATDEMPSAVRIFDCGGLVWQSEEDCFSLDAALEAADAALAELAEQGEL